MRRKEKSSSQRKSQALNIEGRMDTENWLFNQLLSNHFFKQESTKNSKMSRQKKKKWWKTKHLHGLKIPPHRPLLIAKWRNDNFTVEKSGVVCPQKGSLEGCGCLPKVHNPNLIRRKRQTNPNSTKQVASTLLLLPKKEDKARLRNASRWKETTELAKCK